MKKITLPVIAGFILIAFYLVSGAHNRGIGYVGFADALGSEEDEHARETYELTMLRDPATGKIPEHIREKELAFAATLPSDRYLAPGRTTAPLVWQSRGPWNVGGRTRALAIDVANENNIIAGSCSGGMWRSTDGGNTWTPATTPGQYKSVSCVAQDTRPGHTNVWYYGSGEGYGASATETGAYYLGNGIYKSTDGGVTWNVLPSTTSSSFSTFDVWGDLAWNIVTDPSDTVHDVVYAAAAGAIYRSADGGATWTAVLGTLRTSYFTDVAISKTGVVYATLDTLGATKGIFRSTDGVTWANITPPNFPTNYNRIKIGISPSDENQVYFLGNTPGFGMPDTNFVKQVEWNSLWRYTYVSGDGSGAGGTWQDRSMNLPHTGGLFDKYTCQGSYDIVVKVKPDDTNVVFIGGTNLYRSTSAFADDQHTEYYGGYKEGATLPVVNLFLNHHPDQHELVFYPGNPNRMLSGNDGGIFYCNDNTVSTPLWLPLNNGYLTTMFYTCAIDHATTSDIIVGGAQDNGSWFTNSTTQTSPWRTPMGGDGSYCAIADYSNAYYFSLQNGKMIKAQMDPAGNTYDFARIDPIGGRGYQFVNPYTLDPNNNNLMYLAAGKFLWRNNNLAGIPMANNWDSISTNWFRFPDSNLITGGSYYISAVAASRYPANRIYLAVSSSISYQRKLYRLDSANTATHIYHDITSALFPTGGGGYSVNVSCIAVDPTNADNVMVAFSNYGVYSLFYSSDGGTTWKKVAGNLETNKTTGTGDGPSLRWASIIPVSNGKVYMVGTSVGLFATTQLNDTNTVWVRQGANTIGNAIVDMIDYRTTDGLVVAATHSSGIYSSHITSTGDITGVKNLAVTTEGFNFINYPNPFNTQTTIQFDLKAPGHVNIQVLDPMGRLVRTVADESTGAGQKTYVFEAGGLPAGIYYCTLRAGEYAETKRLVLVK